MTSPERVEFEAGRLAQWKEEQKFGEVSFLLLSNLVYHSGKKKGKRTIRATLGYPGRKFEMR